MVELLHPQTNTKPKIFKTEPRRQGGSLSARCECGWYCNHNHKSMDQGWICVARHVISIKGLEGEVAARDLAHQLAHPDEEE